VLIKEAFLRRQDNSAKFPILSGKAYTNSEVRKKAAAKHLDDLISEEGKIRYFKEFFDKNKGNAEYQRFYKSLLYMHEMSDFLTAVKAQNPELQQETERTLLNVLLDHGIVRELRRTKSIAYAFAFLYKYPFGLQSNWE
jgi:hypothetical protein